MELLKGVALVRSGFSVSRAFTVEVHQAAFLFGK